MNPSWNHWSSNEKTIYVTGGRFDRTGPLACLMENRLRLMYVFLLSRWNFLCSFLFLEYFSKIFVFQCVFQCFIVYLLIMHFVLSVLAMILLIAMYLNLIKKFEGVTLTKINLVVPLCVEVRCIQHTLQYGSILKAYQTRSL